MSKSSPRWLQEHETDKYVKQAHQDGFRSRAVYKLAQINERDHLFRPGMTIIDLGAAPGGWSQWIMRQMNGQARLIALDILPMDTLADVTFIQGDFREETVLTQLLTLLGEHKADLVMSDMSPNMMGMKQVDQPRAMLLAELARDLAREVLKPGGVFLTKMFQGEGSDHYIKSLRQLFKQVMIRKPDASRSRSSEVYVVAKQFIGEKEPTFK
jgi:23S rRNA (uridine2552-2'-O)-methyltransferase